MRVRDSKLMANRSFLLLAATAAACSGPEQRGDADAGVDASGDGDAQDAIDLSDGAPDGALDAPSGLDADAPESLDGSPGSCHEEPIGWVDDSTVRIGNGAIHGSVVESSIGVPISEFMSIPYALPPGGERRWRSPEPMGCFDEPVEATEAPPWCQQVDNSTGEMAGQEDCLFLNVWAPANAEGPLPVMFWIHGGGMWYGHAHADGVTSGRELAARGVVVVSVHFRVGSLGWIADPVFGDENPHGASGNYGLMDVVEALRWVQENINAFGGDSDRVTIFGLSGGADRVLYLMASPEAAGLFHRAVAQEGTAWTMDVEDSTAVAFELRTHLGCDEPGATSDAIKACLRAADPEDVARFSYVDHSYYANVDGFMLPRPLAETYAHGEHNHVPFISFVANEDRGHIIREAEYTTPEAWEATIRDYLGTSPVEMVDAVVEAYPFGMVTPEDNRWTEVYFETHMIFNCRHRLMSRHIARTQAEPVYAGVFQECPDDPICALGAYHGAEVPYLFQFDTGHDDSEWALADDMTEYWIRFATDGDPNGGALEVWPVFEQASELYFIFDSDEGLFPREHVEAGYLDVFCDVWDPFWPHCGNGIVDWGESCDDGNAVEGDGCSNFCIAD